MLQIRGFLVVAVKRSAPRDHVDGIVVEQFQLRCKFGDVVPRAGAGGQELIFTAPEAGQHGKRLLGGWIGDIVALIENELHLVSEPLDIAHELLFVLADLIKRQDHIIAGMNALHIGQPLHKHIGKACALQDDIPVVADGDGARNDPYAVGRSGFHTVFSCENGGRRFSATLFPLQEGIPLLERQVDVVALEGVQVDISLILHVPILKSLDPCRELRTFGHLRERLLLIVIFTALPAQQPFITRKPFRLIVQHRLIDGDRCAHLAGQKLCHLSAVCFVDKAVFLLYQTDFVPLRRGVLTAQSLLQIGQHFGFGELRALPLLVGHILRLPLCIKTVDIGKARIVLFLRGWMASDLIQVFLHPIEKVAFCGSQLGHLQKDPASVILKIGFCHHDKLLVNCGCRYAREAKKNGNVRKVGRVPPGRPAGRGAFLLPELDLCCEAADAAEGKCLIRQHDLPQKAEPALHHANGAFIGEAVREKGCWHDDGQNTERLEELGGFQTVILMGRHDRTIRHDPAQVKGGIAQNVVKMSLGVIVSDIALNDVGPRVEVTGNGIGVGIDLAAVGIVLVWQEVKEVSHAAGKVRNQIRVGKVQG